MSLSKPCCALSCVKAAGDKADTMTLSRRDWRSCCSEGQQTRNAGTLGSAKLEFILCLWRLLNGVWPAFQALSATLL
jgi:hypothetical protein